MIGALPYILNDDSKNNGPKATEGAVQHSNLNLNLGKVGGSSRNRTGVHGFAIRCVTTPPSSLPCVWWEVNSKRTRIAQVNIHDIFEIFTKTPRNFIMSEAAFNPIKYIYADRPCMVEGAGLRNIERAPDAVLHHSESAYAFYIVSTRHSNDEEFGT